MIGAVVPPGLGERTALVLVAASFAGSFITVAFGIGGGAALLAVMATLLPPVALIPIHGAVQTGSNLGRASPSRSPSAGMRMSAPMRC